MEKIIKITGAIILLVVFIIAGQIGRETGEIAFKKYNENVSKKEKQEVIDALNDISLPDKGILPSHIINVESYADETGLYYIYTIDKDTQLEFSQKFLYDGIKTTELPYISSRYKLDIVYIYKRENWPTTEIRFYHDKWDQYKLGLFVYDTTKDVVKRYLEENPIKINLNQ